VQVTKLGVGSRPGGGVWFGISGEITVASVLKAVGSDIVFKLDRAGGGYKMAGVDVGDIRLDFQFPESAPTVHAWADISWQMEGDNYRFTGEGGLSILKSIDIRAGFLYGHDSSGYYWLAKATLPLGPSGIPLSPVPLAIYGIGGGIAYGVPVSAFDVPLKDVKPSHDGSYLFSAQIQIGTNDGGFTVFGDGRLTIKTGGGAGVRFDLKAWVLKSNHTGGSDGEMCMQYAGGAFDAGLAAHFDVMGGLLAVSAPSGADVCTTSAVSIHFGAGADWYIWFGTKATPISVTVLFVSSGGWLTIDGSGVGAGLFTKINKKYCIDFEICEACAWFKYELLIEAKVTFSPVHAYGHFKAGVGGGVSVCGEGLSFDGELELTAEAPSPTRICGEARLTIHTPNWLPNVHPHIGICL
jgi:hypothetical protein